MNPIIILGGLGAAALLMQKPKASAAAGSTSFALIDASERSNPKSGAAQLVIEGAISSNSISTVLATGDAIDSQFGMPKTANNVRAYGEMLRQNRNAGGNIVAGALPTLTDMQVVGRQELAHYYDEIGWNPFKAVGKAAKSLGKVAKSVVRSNITKAGVGVLAVAFPAVGVPAAAAVATANIALDKIEAGQAAVTTVQRNVNKLAARAKVGDPKAAVAVNAMQVAIANRKARRAGVPAPRPVALKKGPKPAAPRARARPPTSLYKPTQKPAQLASALSAGGSALGRKLLAAVQAGKSAEVPQGIVVLAGRRPIKPKRVWLGKPPTGIKCKRVNGAHVVTKSGLVVTGQVVYTPA